MRVSRVISQVDVVGRIWMPGATAAMSYTLTPYDIDSIRGEDGAITREDVEGWLATHAGDFQSIIDFRATIGDGEFDCNFATDDGEALFYDCTNPGDE